MKSANVHSLLPKGFVADITLVGFPENKNYTVKNTSSFHCCIFVSRILFPFFNCVDPDPQSC